MNKLFTDKNENFGEDSILFEDLVKIADSDIPLQQLNNQTVFITGATGMLGSQLVKALLFYNRRRKTNIKVLALARSEKKANKIFSSFLEDKNLEIICGDILTGLNIPEQIDYIIHGASITGSLDFIEYPVDTIKTAIMGSYNILEIARAKKVKCFLYISSLEVYGITNNEVPSIGEEDYGYINPINVRSSYSESKRMVECMCVSFAKQYGLPIRIARLCQTFGAGVEYTDSRVFAQFARCVIEKKDIILHTKGETVRNYCYTRDAVKALLYIMINGDSVAYNVANMSTAISIYEMAQMVIKLYPEAHIQLLYDITEAQKYGYNPTIKIKLDTSKLQTLGWKAEIGLEEMFQRMIDSMSFRSSGKY